MFYSSRIHYAVSDTGLVLSDELRVVMYISSDEQLKRATTKPCLEVSWSVAVYQSNFIVGWVSI